MRNHRLIDNETSLLAPGKLFKNVSFGLYTINVTGDFRKLLSFFPVSTKPARLCKEASKHFTEYYINTSQGPPIFSKPRRPAA